MVSFGSLPASPFHMPASPSHMPASTHHYPAPLSQLAVSPSYPTGSRGNPNLGASKEAGQRKFVQHRSHVGQFRVQESYLHHFRTPLHEPLRTHQEKQVSGFQSSTRAQVRPQHPPVSRRAPEKPHHSLRLKTGKCSAQATGTQRHQGRTGK